MEEDLFFGVFVRLFFLFVFIKRERVYKENDELYSRSGMMSPCNFGK